MKISRQVLLRDAKKRGYKPENLDKVYRPRTQSALQTWATKLLDGLREQLSTILPLQSPAIEFINQIRNVGIIKPELITNDTELAENIRCQPALYWVAQRQKIQGLNTIDT